MSVKIFPMLDRTRCVLAHRQGVSEISYQNFPLVCENTHMKKVFPMQLVRQSLQRLMEERGDKAKPLAAALGISETGIRDIFLEKTKSVGGPKLAAIAQHYGVSVDAIMDGTATTLGADERAQGLWVNAKTLEPILAQCLRLAPMAGWSERDAGLLAQSVEYGLRFLGAAGSSDPTQDDLSVAGRAASFRLQELRSQA